MNMELKKIQKIILMNNAVFRKTMENVRYETCSNWSWKELFGVKIKLSCNKKFLRYLISNTNEKNADTHE